MAARSDPWLEQRAWALAGAELERRSRRWHDQFLRVMESTGTVSVTAVGRTGPGVGAAMKGERRQRRLASLQFALADTVGDMTADEQRALREDNVVPDDFVDRVLRRAKELKKQVR